MSKVTCPLTGCLWSGLRLDKHFSSKCHTSDQINEDRKRQLLEQARNDRPEADEEDENSLEVLLEQFSKHLQVADGGMRTAD